MTRNGLFGHAHAIALALPADVQSRKNMLKTPTARLRVTDQQTFASVE